MRALVIEDDPGIRELVVRGLAEAGYFVEAAADGKGGLQKAMQSSFDVIVLDLMLPGMSGWDVCKSLRERRTRTPILMLTARDTVDDRVNGLEIGADDYLVKPFDFRELLARVRSLCRRDKVHKTRVICVADLEIDTGAHLVRRAGTKIALSHREYELLEAMAAHEGQVLSREAIQDRIWQSDNTFSNTVDVYIGLLRKKIDAGSSVKLIHTIRGVGYSLRSPEAKP